MDDEDTQTGNPSSLSELEVGSYATVVALSFKGTARAAYVASLPEPLQSKVREAVKIAAPDE